MSSNIMKIENFSKSFSDVKVCYGNRFSDDRGFLNKNFFGDEFKFLMPSIDEVFYSSSKKNVIRGMHLQKKPNELKKLIYCIEGEVLDVFIDVRHNSSTFGELGSIKLKENDNLSIFLPEGFAHGYLTLSKNSKVLYLQSGIYSANHEITINPLSIKFDWPISKPILSKKDMNSIKFEEFLKV